MNMRRDRNSPDPIASPPRLPRGFVGAVFAADPVGGPRIEGLKFIVRGPVPRVPDSYFGHFGSDPQLCHRYVFRELQADPERQLEIMRTIWAQGLLPEMFEKLFPDDFPISEMD